MSSSDAIGGYLELETAAGRATPDGAVLLNSARNCLGHVVQAAGVSHLHVPRYICDAVVEPLERLGVPYDFYDVSEDLEIAGEVALRDESDAVLVVNYFGVMDDYVAAIAGRLGRQAILDCSQAFYSPPLLPSATFYSPRKFFGVPDGGILHADRHLAGELPVDVSFDRFTHLVKRIDLGAEAAYTDFRRDEGSLDGQPPKAMSRLTRRLLMSVDTEAARLRRLENFGYLHERLAPTNGLPLVTTSRGPLCYPYLSGDDSLRERLIAAKVFVPTYWPNVLEWCDPSDVAHHLASNVLALPIDQRYGPQHMQRIAEVVSGR